MVSCLAQCRSGDLGGEAPRVSRGGFGGPQAYPTAGLPWGKKSKGGKIWGASERASDRASERASERASDRASERPSERATERAAGERRTTIIVETQDTRLIESQHFHLAEAQDMCGADN